MKQLFDFFPILLFFIVYKFYLDLPDGLIVSINDTLPFMAMQPGDASHAIYLATLSAILATLLQVGLTIAFTHRVEKMHLITLILLVVVWRRNPLPEGSGIHQMETNRYQLVFAAVFAGSQFIGSKSLVERMMGHALEIKDHSVWKRLNMAWVLFFIFSGVANLLVAFNFSEEIWVDFKLFGLMGLTLIFVIGQSFYLASYLPQDDSKSNKENS